MKKKIAPPFLFKKNLKFKQQKNKQEVDIIMIILLQPPAILSLKVFGRIWDVHFFPLSYFSSTIVLVKVLQICPNKISY